MKKVICFFVLAFLFSSFTAVHSQVATPAKSTTSKGKAYQLVGTVTQTDGVIVLCNGDEVHFPEVTVHFDLHGVENGNLSMIQGKTTITGTGYSIRTGEVFTLDYRYKENEIDLFTSVDVTTVRVKTIAIGSQGSVYITTFRYHVTWNANNEMTAYVERGTEDCN